MHQNYQLDAIASRCFGMEKIGSWLHCFAAVLLILFSFSHLGFLTIRDLNHDVPNPVFPFLINWDVYLTAAILELFTGIFCFRERGGNVSSIVVLTFVGLILLYWWTFHFAGGHSMRLYRAFRQTPSCKQIS